MADRFIEQSKEIANNFIQKNVNRNLLIHFYFKLQYSIIILVQGGIRWKI